MTTIFARSLLALSLALGATAMSAAHADAICDQDPDWCQAPNYAAFWPSRIGPSNGGVCPGTGGEFFTVKCLQPEKAPLPVSVSCVPSDIGLLCEAWPQADGALHYEWSLDGDIALNYQPVPDSAAIYIDCASGGSGTVSVAVISPGFATASARVSVECDLQPFMGGIEILPGVRKK